MTDNHHRQPPPPPPPPRFYNSNTTGINNNNNNNNNNNSSSHSSSSEGIKKSCDDDDDARRRRRSVLSPNLKYYLEKNTHPTLTTTNAREEAEEEGVYSPHLAALSSPTATFTYTATNYNNDYNNNNNYNNDHDNAAAADNNGADVGGHDDDGLLHSIFSVKKKKKQQQQKQRRRRRRGGRRRNGGSSSLDNGKEEDVVGLFSPGVQEFDLDEALANNNNNNNNNAAAGGGGGVGDGSSNDAEAANNNGHNDDERREHHHHHHRGVQSNHKRGGGGDEKDNDDEIMTLDSVDRIVRGDYLQRHNHNGGTAVASSAAVAAVNAVSSFASPTAAATAAVSSTLAAMTVITTGMTTPVIIGNTIKTPTYSTPPYNNGGNEEEEHDYFYTPAQEKNDWIGGGGGAGAMSLSTTSSRGGGGNGSLSSLLAPVWEAAEEEVNEDNTEEVTPHHPFQTPKEYHSVERRRSDGGGGGGSRVRWNMVEQRQEDDEGEEFFSPLMQQQHRAATEMTTPKHHQEQEQRMTLENESYNDTIMEEWKSNNDVMEVMQASNEIDSSSNQQKEEQQQQQQNVASSPPLASPKYSEMKEELQQMLVEAKRLTPRKEGASSVPTTESSPMNGFVSDDADDEKDDVQQTTMTTVAAAKTTTTTASNNVLFSPSPLATPATQNSCNYSPPSTTNTPNSHHHHYHHHHHLHSSSISSLPPDALTVDFVRQCDCLDTLRAILSLLSSDDHNDDVMNNHGGKNARGKKQLRYPSLVRYVEKRMKIVAEDEDELKQHYQAVDRAPSSDGEDANEGADKENVSPGEHQELSYANHDNNGGASDTFIQGRRNVPSPLETISLSQSPGGGESNEMVEGNEWSIHHHHRQITPENQSIEERSESMMTHETSLDMNLSESLDDESYFWRQDGVHQELEKVETMESLAKTALDAGKEHVDNDVAITPSAPQEEDFGLTTQYESHTDLQQKLSSSLAAHAHLTKRVESLVKEHAIIKDELTSKLNQAREQLSQRQIHEKEEYTKQVSQLVQVNQTLEQEISSLKGRLEAVDQQAVDAATQAEFQLNQTRLIQSKLSKDNERLGKESDEARQARDKAAAELIQLKQMVDEQISSADTNNNIATKRMQKGFEAAKFASHALANALAISEKDLSEALHQKETNLRECNTLRKRIVKLQDKSSFLTSKVNEMTRELESSHVYIDQLLANLQSNHSPSKELKAELERRESQWLELEHQYSRRIRELERQIASQSGGSKVSMSDYAVALRECRKHQSEAAQKQQVVDELESTVNCLKQQIETMRRRPSPRNGVSTSMTTRGKSISTLMNYGKKVHNESSVSMGNDENKMPTVSGEAGGEKIRRKQLKAVGGRKGLSEQLRRARAQEIL